MNKKVFLNLSKNVDERVTLVVEFMNMAIEEFENNGETERYVYLREKAREVLLITLIGNQRMIDCLEEDYKTTLDGVTITNLFKTQKQLKWIAKAHNYYVACSDVLLETAKENNMINEDEIKVNTNDYEFNK